MPNTRRRAIFALLLALPIASILATSSAGAGTGKGNAMRVDLRVRAWSGNVQVGSALAGSLGTWQGASNHYFAAWQRCDTSGANCAPTGATGLSYTIPPADAGATLQIVVFATNKN